jgi:hypothetical protein
MLNQPILPQLQLHLSVKHQPQLRHPIARRQLQEPDGGGGPGDGMREKVRDG